MFRKNLDEVIQRNIDFASDAKKEGILLHVETFTDVEKPKIKPLEQWNFPYDYKEYMDAYIKQHQVYWQNRSSLNDDLIPCLKPYYGIAEHSALLGGKVTYGGDTSYHDHPLKTWEDFDKLSLSLENENFKMLLDSMAYLKAKEKEYGYIATLRGGEAPMDMANAIRGNDIFLDFYDEEENVHKLIDLCLQAGRFTFKHQKEIIGELNGGTMSGFNVWLPGNSIGHVSEDASSMCASSVYTKFGKSYLDALLKDYDCTILHVHTMGRHVLPEFASMEKIKFIQLTYDPNQPSPIDVYKQNAELLKDKIVVVNMYEQEVLENLEFLHKNKSIVVLQQAKLENAKKLANMIHAL